MIAATNTHTHIYARAQTQDASLPRFSPFNGGEEGNPFRGCPVIRGYPRERSPCSRREEERGGVVRYTARGMNERTNETRGGRRGGGGRGGGEPVFERSWRKWWLIHHIYWPTLPSYRPHPRHPPSAATNCPVTTPRTGRTDGRTAGRPAGRPLLPRHRCDPLSDTPPPSHLPQPRPCVSFARRNYVTVARTSRPKFSFSARTWIVR